MTIIITKDVKSERRIGRKRLLGGNDRFHFATKCSYKTFYVFSIYYAKKPEETQQQHHFPPPSSSSPQAEQAASEARLPLDSPEQPLPAKHHLKIMWSLSRSYYTHDHHGHDHHCKIHLVVELDNDVLHLVAPFQRTAFFILGKERVLENLT